MTARRPRPFALILILGLCCYAAGPARCAGTILPETATSPVRIPSQSALIAYQDGVQYMAIDTDFVGRGTNFAWVLPLPSVPEITELSDGFFPSLHAIFRPSMADRIQPYYLLICGLCVLVGVIMHCVRRRTLAPLLLFVVAGLVVAMLLPVASHSRSTPTVNAVLAHGQKTLDTHDVTTISSDNPTAVVAWLKRRGYPVRDAILPVLERYVAKGWVFVAGQLSRPASDKEPATPHPLAFIFRTEEPVFPLGLTATHLNALTVDLYVFGPSRAEAGGFSAVRCDQPAYPDVPVDLPSLPSRVTRTQPSPALTIRHIGLRDAVKQAAVATHLRATITPDAVGEDVAIAWKPFVPHRAACYSARGAITFVLNLAVPALILAIGMAYLLSSSLLLPNRATRWLFVVMILAVVTASGYLYSSLPKVPVYQAVDPAQRSFAQHSGAATAFEKMRRDLYPAQPDVLRRFLSQFFQGQENFLTGSPLLEEDSPGNYTIRTDGRKLHYLCYDYDGAEILIWSTELSRRAM